MNHLEVSAQVIERSALRYTPAGLPALDLKLQHESTLDHAGAARKVVLELQATAIGEQVALVDKLVAGQTAIFSGFLAKQRYGKGPMLHIQAVRPTPSNPIVV